MKYILKAPKKLPQGFVDALRAVLCDVKLDAATKAISLSLPSEAEIGLTLKGKGQLIDPIDVYEKRQHIARLMASELIEDLWQVYVDTEVNLDERASDGLARGQRALKNLCLAYIAKVESRDASPIAASLVAGSANMTDQTDGLGILGDIGGKLAEAMFQDFEQTYKAYPTIMDEWMSLQASSRKPGVLRKVKKLTQHKAFSLSNPNRVSSLIGVFAGNPFGFHAADGSGYKFVADMLIKLDQLNPLASGRLAKVFLRWKDFDTKRQQMMKRELKRLAARKNLTPNLREVVSKSLKA